MTSKRYKKLPEKTKDLPAEVIKNLIPKLKNNCTSKFDESIDLSIQINNKQKKNEINLRTIVNLPAGSGKKIKVAVVCEEAKSKEAKDAGADIVGGEDFIEKIKSGELNFEKLICTPKMMIKLSKLGKILGPKGLMPNPKLGSVTEDIKNAELNSSSVKLIASCEDKLTVSPVEVKNDDPLCVDGTLNAISFTSEHSGTQTIIGRGAGGIETASSIIRDIIDIRKEISKI